MPNPELQQLLQQLQSQDNLSPNHKALIDALQNYDRRTAPFRQLQRRRKLPLVTARDKTDLMALHTAIGSAAETLLASEDEPKELKDLVKKITALASGSYNALLQYDPAKKPRTLSSLEEEVRTLTLHKGNLVLNGVLKDAQSERIPLSFLDSKGNRVSGVFTKKTDTDLEKMYENAFKPLTSGFMFRVRGDSNAVLWLRDHLKEHGSVLVAGGKKNPTGDDILAYLAKFCATRNRQGDIVIDPGRLKSFCGNALREASEAEGGPYDEDSIQDNTWRELAKNLSPIALPVLLTNAKARIPFKSRLDNRNAAMSVVADLMGAPNIIARSKSMKLIDENGNEIEGTFMEAAKGWDPKNLPPEAEHLRPDSLAGTNGKAFKDIANLQILDYLCGNIDRHYDNMLYQFDANGKLCGVQGIDNDCAFGLLGKSELGDPKRNYRWITNISNMKVIPADTAKRIMAMDGSTLKYALRGYGLSDKELHGAVVRLNGLKSAITKSQERIRAGKKPILKVMSDSDFKRANVRDLAQGDHDFLNNDKDGGIGNTFNLVAARVLQLPGLRMQQEAEYRDLKQAALVDMGNRASRHVPGMERAKASSLETMLNKRTWWGFSSPNYESLQKSVATYIRTYKSIENRLNQANDEENKRMARYDQDLEAVVSEADLNRMRDASQQMRDAAWTYLKGKMPDLDEENLEEGGVIPYPHGASDYTKNRINAAIDAYRVAEQGCEIKPVERQTAQDNLQQAQAARQQRRAERNPELIVQDAPDEPKLRIGQN